MFEKAVFLSCTKWILRDPLEEPVSPMVTRKTQGNINNVCNDVITLTKTE